MMPSSTVSTLLLLLGLMITLSNLLVILLVLYDKALRKLRYVPLVSLAVADMFMGILALAIVFFDYWNREIIASRVIWAVITFGPAASFLNMVAVCSERWIAIFRPLRYAAFLQRKNIILLICSAWLLATIIALLTLGFNRGYFQLHSKTVPKFEQVYLLVVCSGYFISVVAVGLMQFRIIRTVKRHLKRTAPLTAPAAEVSTNESSASVIVQRTSLSSIGQASFRNVFKRREFASAVAVNLMYLAVIFTWTPFVILIVLFITGQCQSGCLSAIPVTVALLLLNCFINPLIYTIRIKDFRRTFVKLCSKMICWNWRLCCKSLNCCVTPPGTSQNLDVEQPSGRSAVITI